ncbi:MAG: Xaa-Pro aminopeptidase [Gemmatimonadota bacterium]
MSLRTCSLRRPASMVATCLALGVAALEAQSMADQPQVFGRGVFSTAAWDFFVALAPDQQTALVCRANANFSFYVIFETRRDHGGWSTPVVTPFSGRWSDADPHFSPDGKQLFFISNRPVDGGNRASDNYDIWVVERAAGGAWGEPHRLQGPVNADSTTEWSPSPAANGDLYFGSARAGGKGGEDLYVARLENGAYSVPENLGDSVNSTGDEVEPWIAPDESYLLFSGRRPDGLGGYDLWISYRKNGVWQKPIHLAGGINSIASDFNQSVSPDGRYLYFSSTRGYFNSLPLEPMASDSLQARLAGPGNGLGDIYRIEMSRVLENQ